MKIHVHGILRRRALVTRGAAREIASAIRELEQPDDDEQVVVLDFEGIEAVTPSFVDELLGILTGLELGSSRKVRFLLPPTRLSEKFKAIGRARRVEMSDDVAEEWVIELPPVAP
jgi:hypothetical protein